MLFALSPLAMAACPARARADNLQGKPWPVDSVLGTLANHGATLARLSDVLLPGRALFPGAIPRALREVIATGLSARAFRFSVPVRDINSNQGDSLSEGGREGARGALPLL